jgi:deoxyribodipyrimidine photo-lyase
MTQVGTMNRGRERVLAEGRPGSGPVVYWMSRDQRVCDNWALLFARERAVGAKRPLVVVFCLAPQFLGATLRQYGFMVRGLKEAAKGLQAHNVAFVLLKGEAPSVLPRWLAAVAACELVVDFDPLRGKRKWRDAVAGAVDMPVHEVDAHNVVPCRIASPKQEYGAYTIRPKIHRLLPEFLEPFPNLERLPVLWEGAEEGPEWEAVEAFLNVDRFVGEVDWIKPGEAAAQAALQRFIDRGLENYMADRNDPSKHGQSGLSPYIHFGQLSAQRVALAVEESDAGRQAKDALLEELIVRRELADNFCWYNEAYDRFDGFPTWAQDTLNAHRRDRRPYIYSVDELERGETHDDLWNAAQLEMVKKGKMHGYMRMYWAKKILEWTASPEEAMAAAVYLNDRYELDGRDPNGYAGIAWSIGGVHDRAWGERPVFGKIRYMSYNGARSKFDVKAYIRRIAELT